MGDRFQSAKEFADAFNQVARGMSHSMPPGLHVDPLAQSFRNTNPEGIPTVAPALLLSTGSAAAVATSGTLRSSVGAPAATQAGEPAPSVPKSGSKGMIFAVAAVVGIVAIGGAAYTMRPHAAPPAANTEPPKVDVPAAPAAPPPLSLRSCRPRQRSLRPCRRQRRPPRPN